MSITKNPLTILIIEDNPGDYLILKDYIKRINVPVKKLVHSVNMESIPSLIENINFDLVFLDLSLPDSVGVDSVKMMNQLLPNTAIICLSGFSGDETSVNSISVGAQDYLVKDDFDEKLLAKSIQYSIERKRILENLKVTNERYKFINKATLDTTWDFNFENKTGHWGDGIIRTFGYSGENIVFKIENWQELIHPEDRVRVLTNIDYHMIHQIKNWQDEYRFKAADGTYKEVFSRSYILYNKSGKASHIFGSTSDMTERKSLKKNWLNNN